MTNKPWDATGEGLAVQVVPRLVIGVVMESPKAQCERRGEPGEKVTLEAWRSERMYLYGVTAQYEDADASIRFVFRHPRTRESLLAPGAFGEAHFGSDLGPYVFGSTWDPRVPCVTFGGVQHHAPDPEPVYCTKEMPLVIEAEGTAPIQLVFWGDSHYTVTRHQGFGCPPEHLGEFRGPFGTPTPQPALPEPKP